MLREKTAILTIHRRHNLVWGNLQVNLQSVIPKKNSSQGFGANLAFGLLVLLIVPYLYKCKGVRLYGGFRTWLKIEYQGAGGGGS